MRTASYLALGFVVMAGSASAAMQEKIGSWILSCPGSQSCVMRFDKRLLDQGGFTGDLEIQAQGKSLVPVITLRGLSTEMLAAAAQAGRAEASMRFGGGPREELNCAASRALYICAPKDDAAQTLAAGLPSARSVTVHVSVSVAGMPPLPAQEKSLELSGTNAALARLRIAGPSQVPSPMTASAPQSPGALMAIADKALKAAGYQNGIADLMAQYMRK